MAGKVGSSVSVQCVLEETGHFADGDLLCHPACNERKMREGGFGQ